MKLLYCSSSSTTTSTTTAAASPFDASICNSKSATASCLAGILRRILCSGTLPTHPSDQIAEETNSVEFSESRHLKGDEKIPTPEAPGLVARLMGLESLPDVDLGCARSRPNSVSRSRSMNSVDRLADPKPGLQQQHRRAKSTTSFLEMPTFFELFESDEYFVLSFENGNEIGRFRSKVGKTEMGSGELKQRRTGKCQSKAENRAEKKEDDQGGRRKVLNDLNRKKMQRRDSSDKLTKRVGHNSGRVVKDSKVSLVSTRDSYEKRRVVSVPSNGVIVKPSSNKRTNKKTTTNSHVVKTVEPECTSEDSSPVSVLDCGQFLIDSEVPISEDDSSLTTTSSRRKLSLEIENYERQSPRRDNNLISEETKTEKKTRKHLGSKKKQSHTEEYWEILDDICRLNETELVGASWVQRWTLKHEDFQGVGEELESQILGQLLEELVDQF